MDRDRDGEHECESERERRWDSLSEREREKKNKLEINCFGQTMSILHMKFHFRKKKMPVNVSTTDSKSSFQWHICSV